MLFSKSAGRVFKRYRSFARCLNPQPIIASSVLREQISPTSLQQLHLTKLGRDAALNSLSEVTIRGGNDSHDRHSRSLSLAEFPNPPEEFLVTLWMSCFVVLAMPGAPFVASLLLIVRPGAPSSVLVPSKDYIFLLSLVKWPFIVCILPLFLVPFLIAPLASLVEQSLEFRTTGAGSATHQSFLDKRSEGLRKEKKDRSKCRKEEERKIERSMRCKI